jgi:exopolysaccharide biosynthesis polyprenyl glycosylphosphotransferase
MEDPGDGTVRPGSEVERGSSIGLKRALVATDVIAALLVALLSMTVLIDGRRAAWHDLVLVAVIVASTVGLCGAARLYQARVSSVRTEEIARLARVSILVAVLGVLAAQIQNRLHPILSPIDGVIMAAMLFTFLVIGRASFDAWLRFRRSLGEHCRKLLIVGTGPEAFDLAQIIRDHPELGYRVSGLVGSGPGMMPDGIEYLGTADQLDRIVDETGTSGVLIVAETIGPEARSTMVKSLVDRGVHVHISPGIQGFTYRRLRMVPIAHEPLLYLEPAQHSGFHIGIKRALDLVLATLLLVILSPVAAVVAIAIRLQDGGPAVFRQERIGLDRMPFTFYKFRTMVEGADDRRAEVSEENVRGGPLLKVPNDPRVTRLGRFLRASSIDEIPQLINVARGDMSLVGPRPCLPSEAAEFDEGLAARYKVRPGITGLWQVEARDNPVFRAYRRFDLFYVENWSISLDFVILVLTVQNVVSRVIGTVLRAGGGADDPKHSLASQPS